MFGFNGIPVGIAAPTFLASGPKMWLLVGLGAAISTIVTEVVAKVVDRWGVPGSTAPFVFTTWISLSAAYAMHQVPAAGLPPSLAAPSSARAILGALSQGISQVFPIRTVVTGCLFFVAIAISSLRAALLALMGSIVGLGTAMAFGANPAVMVTGWYGFNAVLTAMALGAAYRPPSWRSTLSALVASILSVAVLAALAGALTPLGLPALTFPYVLTIWIFLLPLGTSALRPRRLDRIGALQRKFSPLARGRLVFVAWRVLIYHFTSNRARLADGTAIGCIQMYLQRRGQRVASGICRHMHPRKHQA